MEAAGIRQSNVVTIESFFILPFVLPGTRFVTLLPYHIGKHLCGAVSMRMLEPPFHIDPITLPMSWHPRSTEDPGHVWLRSQLERISANIEGL